MNNNQSNYKKIVLVVIILAVIIAFVFFKFSRNKESIAEFQHIFEPQKPIRIKNNGKYGYITSEGKVLIEPKYSVATEFFSDYAVVNVDDESIYQFIDKEGNVHPSLESPTYPTYHLEYNVWEIEGSLYDSKLNRITQEGIVVNYIDYGYFEYVDRENKETGIINYKGEKIIAIPANSISVSVSEDVFNKDNENELYVLVEIDSETKKYLVVSLNTGDILYTLDNANDYYFYTLGKGLFAYDNTKNSENEKMLFFSDNKLVYQTTGNERLKIYSYEDKILEIDYGYNYKNLGKTQRTYYYDVKNKKTLEKVPSISTPNLDSIQQTYGFKEYSNSGKYGLMSGEKILVPCEYDDINYLNKRLFNYMKSKGKELVLLEKNGKTELYDLKKSESIITFDSTDINDYDYTTFLNVILYEDDGYTKKEHILYNLLSGKSIKVNSYEFSFGSNYVTHTKDGKITYYNTNLKQIYVNDEN